MRRYRGFDPLLVLAMAAGIVLLLLAAGFALSAAAGGLSWQGVVSAALALVIALLGLLYAWRLGGSGRRE